MLSALFPEVDWPAIRCVGLDMDGTLYDEFEFITQAYRQIADDASELLHDPQTALVWMSERWLEKGSSYPHIFDETFDRFGRQTTNKTAFIDRALRTFRHFEPELRLPSRSRAMLDHLTERYPLFLVSDGNPALQRRKFDTLGLARWFDGDNCVFTGDFGRDGHKPSRRALGRLSLPCPPQQCVYFGDRDTDSGFAAACGMHFVRVRNLIGGKP